MTQVLVTVSLGIIDMVQFFEEPKEAIKALSEHVKEMDCERDDAELFDEKGLIANAKSFLDDNDEYRENPELIAEIERNSSKPIFTIGNPIHPLGFVVASSDDPIGYTNPCEAVSELGQMRENFGRHLKLYRLVPVSAPVASKGELEKQNLDSGVDDFDYSMVDEYVK